MAEKYFRGRFSLVQNSALWFFTLLIRQIYFLQLKFILVKKPRWCKSLCRIQSFNWRKGVTCQKGVRVCKFSFDDTDTLSKWSTSIASRDGEAVIFWTASASASLTQKCNRLRLLLSHLFPKMKNASFNASHTLWLSKNLKLSKIDVQCL